MALLPIGGISLPTMPSLQSLSAAASSAGAVSAGALPLDPSGLNPLASGGALPLDTTGIGGITGTGSRVPDPAGLAGPSGPGFGDLIAKALDSVSATQASADSLATQAATGNASAIHDYLIATTQASLETQLTVAVRDKALSAFQSIMGMAV